MPTLKQIVEERDHVAGRACDYFIQILIVISLVTFSLDTLPDLTNSERTILRRIEIGTIAIFTAEYVIRVFVSSNRLKFVFSFFGLIDLFAILPFYLSTGLDLRAIRYIYCY